MVSIISGILNEQEIKFTLQQMAATPFVDGRVSAGPLGQKIKHNTVMSNSDTAYKPLAQSVLGRISANAEFNVAAIPKRLLPPIFSIYDKDMHYGSHIDASLMGPYPGMRTDLSMTIFLSDPQSYKGGELVMETAFGEQQYKLKPGDAVLYPTHFVHRVNPVRSGRRAVIVTWIESMVRDPAKREILGEMAELTKWLAENHPTSDQFKTAEKSRLNLLRMWADT
jgi:PKHD-type hydroxylase